MRNAIFAAALFGMAALLFGDKPRNVHDRARCDCEACQTYRKADPYLRKNGPAPLRFETVAVKTNQLPPLAMENPAETRKTSELPFLAEVPGLKNELPVNGQRLRTKVTTEHNKAGAKLRPLPAAPAPATEILIPYGVGGTNSPAGYLSIPAGQNLVPDAPGGYSLRQIRSPK